MTVELYEVIYRNTRTGRPARSAPLPKAQAEAMARAIRKGGRKARLRHVSEREYLRAHNISPHTPGGRR